MPALAKQIPQWVLDRFVIDPQSKTGLAWSSRQINGRDIAGQPVGGWREDGYWRIKTSNYRVTAHRIVWTLARGPIDPELQIDHIDGNGLNNRIENLRAVTSIENSNARVRFRNAVPGKMVNVSWGKRGSHRVRIRYMGRTVNVGSFRTIEAAGRARDAWFMENGLTPRYWNFPPTHEMGGASACAA